jgi:proteic killer suppression protein
MILSIRHKGLRLLYDRNDPSKLPAENVGKLRALLSLLDAAKKPQELNLPGFDFHALKGDLQDFYSVKVRANWKLVFRFAGEDVADVDYLDYH